MAIKIASARDVIAVARERGFEVRVTPGPPPMPVLHVFGHTDKTLATPALMDALRAWRLEIIDLLTN